MENEQEDYNILYLHIHYPLLSGWTIVEILSFILVVIWLGILLSWWAYIVIPPYLIGKFIGWKQAKAMAQSVQVVVDAETNSVLEVE